MTHKGCYASEYFNPRTSHEVRQYADIMITEAYTVFQSTHLIRGATQAVGIEAQYIEFQSTHLMQGATRAGQTEAWYCYFNPRTP